MTNLIRDGSGKVPGLLAVLALVPDPRKPRGRRYLLIFVLAVAVAAACTLAGARTFREIGDHATDLPGTPCSEPDPSWRTSTIRGSARPATGGNQW